MWFKITFLITLIAFGIIWVFGEKKGVIIPPIQPIGNFVHGGVMPHHLLAEGMMRDFLLGLPKKTQTIILLAPNHNENGSHAWITTDEKVETEWGNLPITPLVRNMLESQLVAVNNEVLKKEWAVYDVAPLIKELMPGVTLLPLVVSNRATLADIQKMSEVLAGLMGHEDVVLVAAIDFSHYLPTSEANKHDSETLDMIKNFKTEEIILLTGSHLDGPMAMATLLEVMKKTGKTHIVDVVHGNSGEMLHSPHNESTGYFRFYFK